MVNEQEARRDSHRLFGLLLRDFFTSSPFTVEVERDVSEQQQFLDVVIVRRGRGHFAGRLPDGLNDLAAHNLITFKSYREALDGWALQELIGYYVACRKLVSPWPARLLPEDQFRLIAVCARFPHNLAGQVPWQRQQAGVYHYPWGTNVIRVVVAGELPREGHNAPLHLFSASPELVDFGRGAYRQRSPQTSRLLGQLFETLEEEGFPMAYTMEDFNRDYIKGHFRKLTPEERRQALQTLPPEEWRDLLQGLSPEERLAGLSMEQIEQIREYLDRLTASRPTQPRKPRRKK